MNRDQLLHRKASAACRIGLHDYRLQDPPDQKYQPSGRPIFEPLRLVCARCGKEKS